MNKPMHSPDLYTAPAEASDWDLLLPFYRRIYRQGHPLQQPDFFFWQYGQPQHGRAFLVRDEKQVLGQVGAYFEGGYAWIMNVYMDPVLRGQGWVGKLYGMARQFGYPLAATSANEAGLGLYRKMGWQRYANLERMILIRPDLQQLPVADLIRSIPDTGSADRPLDSLHYWKQPGINGVRLADGSTGVAQYAQGGFRFAQIRDIAPAVKEIWDRGFLWGDYVASWNDRLLDLLIGSGWVTQEQLPFPWFLQPVQHPYRFQVSFLSETPMDPGFVVRRYHSDHGRVGSL